MIKLGIYADALQKFKELQAIELPANISERKKAEFNREKKKYKKILEQIGCPSKNPRNTEWLVYIADHKTEVQEYLERVGGKACPWEDDPFCSVLRQAGVPASPTLLSSLLQLLTISQKVWEH